MYLDTDILLALAKPKDWLKPHVKINKIAEPKTSAFAVVEAEIVLEREYSRKEALDILEKIRKLGVKIENVTEVIIEKNLEFLRKFPKLTVFDSVHAAFCYVHKEKIVSTDTVYDAMQEIEKVDPRDM